MAKTTTSTQIRNRKIGSGLMLFFTVGWIVSMVAIQFSIGIVNGYGTHFGNSKRVPPSIVEKAGVGSDIADVVAATSHNADIPLWEDIVRLVASVAALIGIIYFWYVVMSRVGTF